MRTNVKIKHDIHQTDLKKDDQGYIDGYLRAADNRGYAAVVVLSKGIVDFCPLDERTDPWL